MSLRLIDPIYGIKSRPSNKKTSSILNKSKPTTSIGSTSVEIDDTVSNNDSNIQRFWGCGGGKAPGPDGFTFEFIKRYWDIIVISWAKKKKEKLFILKVNFEKAFDSLDWKFLDHIMAEIGFTNKWTRWIHGCLDSTFGSVFVNGSPTKEFKIQKSLRQGNPLSPFLFIIAVEALYVAIQ
ncbi:RNA-directed DNA polymerase, eukaryota [Tanacetum coccineum]